MPVVIVTGSSGLIGSESVRRFAAEGADVVGIDNDLRRYFFGEESSTQWMCERLLKEVPGFTSHAVDIRDYDGLLRSRETDGLTQRGRTRENAEHQRLTTC